MTRARGAQNRACTRVLGVAAVRALALAFAVVVLGVGGGACSFEAGVAPQAQLRCASDADCPTSELCAPAIARCVPVAHRDVTPPSLVEGSVHPSAPYTRAGATFALRFQASEPLFAPPVVRGATLTRAYHLAVAVDDGADVAGGNGFIATLVADASAVEEGPLQIAVDMLDRAGNAGTGNVDAATVFDFTPPTALGATVSTDEARPSSTLTAAVQFAAADLAQDGAPPRFHARFADGAVVDVAAQTLTLSSASASLTIPADAASGALTISLVGARDLAGNSSDDIALPPVHVDAQAPPLTLRLSGGTLVNGTPRYRIGTDVVMDVQVGPFDEAPARVSVALALGSVALAQSAAACASLANTGDVFGIVDCTFSAHATDLGEGLSVAAVEVVDAAGNAASALAPFVVDLTPPSVANATLTPVRPSDTFLPVVTALRPGGKLLVDVVLNEEATDVEVTLTLGAAVATASLTAVGLASYRGVLATPAGADGTSTVTADFADEAGNAVRGVALGDVVVDGTPPASIDARAFLLNRTPWSATPSSKLLQRAPIEPGIHVFALATASSAAPIADAAVADGTGFVAGSRIDLGEADVVRAFLVAVDDAGNASAPAAVATAIGMRARVAADRAPRATPICCSARRASARSKRPRATSSTATPPPTSTATGPRFWPRAPGASRRRRSW